MIKFEGHDGGDNCLEERVGYKKTCGYDPATTEVVMSDGTKSHQGILSGGQLGSPYFNPGALRSGAGRWGVTVSY